MDVHHAKLLLFLYYHFDQCYFDSHFVTHLNLDTS